MSGMQQKPTCQVRHRPDPHFANQPLLYNNNSSTSNNYHNNIRNNNHNCSRDNYNNCSMVEYMLFQFFIVHFLHIALWITIIASSSTGQRGQIQYMQQE